MEACVKGSLVLGAVVTVRRLRRSGTLSEEQLAARLGPTAQEWLDEKIAVGRWYPVGPFCELLDLEWEVGGRRHPEHMRQQGAVAADRLYDSGMYQQLQYADRTGRAESRDGLVRQSKLIVTITGALYSFLESEVRVDPERPEFLEIVFRNADPFSEALRYTTEGFLNRINVRQGSARRWTSERTAPDTIVFRLPLPQRFT